MAATYTVSATGVTQSSSKNMIAISNATGSGKIVKIYRAWMTNVQTGAVSGGLGLYVPGRVTGSVHSSGTGVNFLPHANVLTAGTATPFTGISAAHGATLGAFTHEFSRFVRSSDELAVSGITTDEIIGIIMPFCLVFDSGYGDTNVEPITLRENQAFAIKADATGTYNGTSDVFVELTIV